jgi:hypothetical protein
MPVHRCSMPVISGSRINSLRYIGLISFNFSAISGINQMKIVIQAELPEELFRQAQTYVQEGWVADFNELLTDALRRYLESHSAQLTEAFIRDDLEWGLSGRD